MCYWYFKGVTITKAFQKNLKESNQKPNKILVDKHNKYSNTYHRTIKMKPVDVKPSTYFNSSKEINDEDLKFKFGDIIRRSKYKNNFAKSYASNWSEDVSVIKKVKNTVPWWYVVSDQKGEETVGTFHKKELQKINQKSLELKK